MITEFDLERALQVCHRAQIALQCQKGEQVTENEGIIIVMSVAATMAEFLQVDEDDALESLFKYTKRKGN